MEKQSLCPHAQGIYRECIHSGKDPVIFKEGGVYVCQGENMAMGENTKITNCAYLHELSLLEKISNQLNVITEDGGD